MVTLFRCFVQAIKVLNMIKLHGKPIRVNKVSNCFFYFDYLPSYLFFSCEFSRFRTLTDGFVSFDGEACLIPLLGVANILFPD